MRGFYQIHARRSIVCSLTFLLFLFTVELSRTYSYCQALDMLVKVNFHEYQKMKKKKCIRMLSWIGMSMKHIPKLFFSFISTSLECGHIWFFICCIFAMCDCQEFSVFERKMKEREKLIHVYYSNGKYFAWIHLIFKCMEQYASYLFVIFWNFPLFGEYRKMWIKKRKNILYAVDSVSIYCLHSFLFALQIHWNCLKTSVPITIFKTEQDIENEMRMQ